MNKFIGWGQVLGDGIEKIRKTLRKLLIICYSFELKENKLLVPNK